jgi:hypothetical protein
MDREVLEAKFKIFNQLADIQDRKHRFKKYKACFIGEEILDSLIFAGVVTSRQVLDDKSTDDSVILSRTLLMKKCQF